MQVPNFVIQAPLSTRLAEALRVATSYMSATHGSRYQPINREKIYADGKLVREALAEYDTTQPKEPSDDC
jgi:hypothetical protein